MSENGNKMNKNKKIAIFVTAALVVTIPATIGIMCYYKLGPFSEKPSAPSAGPNNAKNHESIPGRNNMVSPQKQKSKGTESDATALANQDSASSLSNGPKKLSVSVEFTKPLESASFDFKVNGDIQNRKAFAAYTKLLSLSNEEKDELKLNHIDALTKNHQVKDVVFTDTENIGIVHVIAAWMSSHPATINQIILDQSQEVSRDFLTLQNLLVELACHIKMRKKGENISLLKYNEYLYTSEKFKKYMRAFGNISDLYEQAVKEASIFDYIKVNEPLFNIDIVSKEAIIPKKYISEIISPKKTLENKLT